MPKAIVDNPLSHRNSSSAPAQTFSGSDEFIGRGLKNQKGVPLLVFVLLLAGCTGATVVGVWLIGKKTAEDGVDVVKSSLKEELVNNTVDAVQSYLQMPFSALAYPRAMAMSPLGNFNISDPSVAFPKGVWLMAEACKAYPGMSGFYFGTEEGYFMAAKCEENRQLISVINTTDSQRYFYYASDDFTSFNMLPDITTYDPRNRTWYIMERAHPPGAHYYAPVYVCATSKKPCLTAAVGVYDSKGRRTGVIEADYDDLRLPSLLRNVKVGKTGGLFVIERDGNLIVSTLGTSTGAVHHDNIHASATRLSSFNSTQVGPIVSGVMNAIFGGVNDPFLRTITDESLKISFGGSAYEVVTHEINPASLTPPIYNIDWLLVVVLPHADYMEEVDHNNNVALIISISLAVAVTLLLIFVSWAGFIHPLRILSKTMEQVQRMELDKAREMTPFGIVLEIRWLTASFVVMVKYLHEFRAYIAPGVLAGKMRQMDEDYRMSGSRRSVVHLDMSEKEMKQQSSTEQPVLDSIDEEWHSHTTLKVLQLGRTQRRNSSVMVADIDLYAYTQELNEDVEKLASGFINHVLRCTNEHEGVILSISAGCVVVTWNVHVPAPRHIEHSFDCAVAISQPWQEDPVPWWCITLDTGPLMAFNTGNETQRAPVVYGDPLRFALHLVPLCKMVNSRTLVSESWYKKQVNHDYLIPIDLINNPFVPGDVVALTVYQIVACRGDEFLNGFRSLKAHDYPDALQHFHLAVTNAIDNETDKKSKAGNYLYQATRLWKLTSYLVKEGAQQCVRSYLGWENIDRKAKDEMLPQELKDKIESHKPKLNYEKVKLVTHKGPTDSEKLLEQLHMHPAVDNRMNGDPPVEFIDSNSHHYMRSCKRLGRGAFGEVWLGMSPDGRLFALKFQRIPVASNSSAKQQIAGREVAEVMREVSVLSQYKHENIVSYCGSGLHHGYLLIALEYVPGGSLSTLLHDFRVGGNKGLPIHSVKNFLIGILRGLSFLHTKDVIHRDLKPGNVLVSTEGICKLADFGASHIQTTTQDEIRGTPLFMSPEACRGQPSSASDIWAVGVIACQLIFDLPWALPAPFNNLKFMENMREGKVPMRIPAKVEEVGATPFVLSCLDVNPNKRLTACALLDDNFLN